MVGSLTQTSNQGSEAIAQLTQKRQEFLQLQENMKAIGPAGLSVANGLEKIRDAASTTSDRLTGLKMVLQGLGLMETTAEEAAWGYQEAIRSVGEAAINAVDGTKAIGTALLDTNGKLKPTEENAANLRNELLKLRDGFLEVAAEGGDPTKAFNDMRPALQALADAFGLPIEKIEELIRGMGAVPEQVSIAMSVQGKDAAIADLTYLQTQLDYMDGRTATVSMKTDEAYNAVNALVTSVGGRIDSFNKKDGVATITLPPGTSQKVSDELAKILGVAQTAIGPDGIKVPATVMPDPNAQKKIQDMMVPREPIKIPVQPANTGNGNVALANDKIGLRGNQPPPVNGQPAPTTAPAEPNRPADAPPPEVKTKFTLEGVDQAKAQLAEVTRILVAMHDRTVNFKIEGTDPAIGALNAVNIALANVRAETRVDFSVGGTDAAIGAVNAVILALQNAPDETVIYMRLDGTDLMLQQIAQVKAALDGLNPTIDSIRANFDGLSSAVSNALAKATAVIQQFASTAITPLNTAAANARISGENLGQGFANGMLDKVDEVQAASMALARAASRPLPRSPAEIGPFSGKGWTPYRGRSLAEGFAEGIGLGAPSAQNAALNMASDIANAMDAIRSNFGMPTTSFGANRTPGVGGKKYYRDIEQSDAELAEARKQRAEEAKKNAAEEANKGSYANVDGSIVRIEATPVPELKGGGGDPNGNKLEAMSAIASQFGLELTSGQRNEPGSFHNDGSAGDFSNGVQTDQMLAFANFIADTFPSITKELIYDDPRFNRQIDEGQFVGGGGGSSGFFAGSGDHSNHVHWAVDMAPVLGDAVQEGTKQGAEQGAAAAPPPPPAQQPAPPPLPDPTRTDLTKDEVAQLIIARGRSMGASDEDIKSALAAGIVESDLQNLTWGDRDSVGVFQQRNFAPWTSNGRNRMNVDDAATSYFEQLAGVGPGTPGQRAQAVQRSAFPEKYDQRLAEAEEYFARNAGVGGIDAPAQGDIKSMSGATAQSAKTNEEILAELKGQDKGLADAIAIAQSPNSSDAEVIRALQDIDDRLAVQPEGSAGASALEDIRSGVMTDRGIKEYDPFEGASTDPFMDVVGMAQNILGLYRTIEAGLQNLGAVGDLLVRGLSNTKDVTTLIDGVQGLVSTVTDIVTTISDLASTAASLAAAAGMAIPGVGQIAGIVSAVTGGIGNINAVIDLVQEAMSIAGQWIGKGLSWLAGGPNGPLMGDVKFLLDQNDNTLKTWSQDNPDDKRIHALPGGQQVVTNNNGPQQLNVYAGPGQDPRKTMDDAMFALKAQSVGAAAYG